MINRLVLENLKHRPVRTLVSAVAIGVQVTLVLTLVGLSRGMVADMLQRMRGVGADVVIRPPNSSLFSFSSAFPAALLRVARERPETQIATGIFVYPIGGVNSVTGIDLAEFNAMSGGFHYLEGGPFRGPDDILVDNFYAAGNHLHAGDTIEVMNRKWRLAGIVEQGKMSRMFVDLAHLQDLTANTARLSSIYIKLRDPAQTESVKAALKQQLENYPVYSIAELTSLVTEANVPMLRQFTDVVIGIGTLVGFLVVFLSMYTAVLERTREIGVLKALGASPALVLQILMRETVLLALCGSALGILMNYGARWMIAELVPTMIEAIVPGWWPIAAAISVVGALCGALYPGLKAARQDVIDALAYE
ncbi:MAG TPA: FtsX-like permease family protein [Bryobacteraceae bacterium]|nr:FtsX-like permease family protein [Bryobacteraceae bacterium]